MDTQALAYLQAQAPARSPEQHSTTEVCRLL